MTFARRPIFWAALSLAFVAANFFAFRAYVAPHVAGKHELVPLIAEKGIIAVLLWGLFSMVGGWRAAGFVRPQGWLWPLMGGTIWLGIVGAAPGGFQYLLDEPALAVGYGLVALLVAFGEEGVFRGIVLHALEKWSVWGAALISSFLFGAMHLLALFHAPEHLRVFFIGQSGAAMAIGLLMAGLTLRYRSILPAVFFHFLLDAVQFWNAGGITDFVKNATENLTTTQIALGVGAAILLFGGWGALLTGLAVRRRSAQQEMLLA